MRLFLLGAALASCDGGTLVIALANARPIACVDCHSPSESWLQHQYADLEAGYTDNVFAIYRVTESGANEVFRESGGDAFGAAEPRWLDIHTVQFTWVHRSSTPGQVLHLPVTATRAEDTWRVNPEPPPPPLP